MDFETPLPEPPAKGPAKPQAKGAGKGGKQGGAKGGEGGGDGAKLGQKETLLGITYDKETQFPDWYTQVCLWHIRVLLNGELRVFIRS